MCRKCKQWQSPSAAALLAVSSFSAAAAPEVAEAQACLQRRALLLRLQLQRPELAAQPAEKQASAALAGAQAGDRRLFSCA